jgi:hypothetical protein
MLQAVITAVSSQKMDITVVNFMIFLTIFAKQIRDNNLLKPRQIPIKSVAVRCLPTAATFDDMHSEMVTSKINLKRDMPVRATHLHTDYEMMPAGGISVPGAGSTEFSGTTGLLSMKATDRSAAAQRTKTKNFE